MPIRIRSLDEITVYAKHDSTYAYFCALSLHDTGSSEQSGQARSFYFDRNHDGTGQPQSDDRKYVASYWYNQYTPQLNGWSYHYYAGTGTNNPYWQSNNDDQLPASAQFKAAYDSSEGYWAYEMRMPLSELNAYGKFSPGNSIGFACRIEEPSPVADWPNGVNVINEATWGNLFYNNPDNPVPELPSIALASSGIALIVIFMSVGNRRKKL